MNPAASAVPGGGGTDDDAPLRYSDLHERLGCPTNILAARLKRLELEGIVAKRRLPPPAASVVYELTDYGSGLRPVLHELAHWGARSLGPPPGDVETCHGWLGNALDLTLSTLDTTACVEFQIDDERVWVSGGAVHDEPPAETDVLVQGDARGLYHLLIHGDASGLRIEGKEDVVEQMVGRSTAPAAA